jgi:thioredoxin:protein disulfide reductase
MSMSTRSRLARPAAGAIVKRLLGTWALLLAFGAAAAVFSQPDLLEPEKAFRISVRALDAEAVEVQFRIADGYYMYRDRFKFEAQDGTVLADAELPAGVWTKDAFFGETQTYRREVRTPCFFRSRRT